MLWSGTFIQTQMAILSSNTDRDVIPHLSLDYYAVNLKERSTNLIIFIYTYF